MIEPLHPENASFLSAEGPEGGEGPNPVQDNGVSSSVPAMEGRTCILHVSFLNIYFSVRSVTSD